MMTKGQLWKLQAAQNHCVKVLDRNNTKPIGDIYKQYKILPIDHMIQLELCKCEHRISHENLPKPIMNILKANGGLKRHHYETRNKSTPNIQMHSSQQFNNSYLCKSIKKYCGLSIKLKSVTKLTTFVRQLKNQLLQS